MSRRPVALLAITVLLGLAAGAKALQNQAEPENSVPPQALPAAPAPSRASSGDEDNTAPKPSVAPPVKAAATLSLETLFGLSATPSSEKQGAT